MPYAYTDSNGIPRTETGSVYIEVSDNGGGGATTQIYDPRNDVDFWRMLAGDPIDLSNITLPSLPGQIAGPGVGGFLADLEKKTGLPAWLIVALAAGGGFLVFKKLGA